MNEETNLTLLPQPPQPVPSEPSSFEELRAEISTHLATCQICRETPTVKYHCGASVAIEPKSQLEPPQPVPEEFPLTVDMGKMPWSKVPIREISPLVWFKYEKNPVNELQFFTVVDGNGRCLFTVNEEGVANFFVNAANIYVHASLTTQV